MAHLDTASKASPLFQAELHLSRVFTARPTLAELTIQPAQFRVLLLRHMCMFLAVSFPPACSCWSVQHNVRLSVMSIDVPVPDVRRRRPAGEAQPGSDTHPGPAVSNAARRKRTQTYKKLSRARHCRLVTASCQH